MPAIGHNFFVLIGGALTLNGEVLLVARDAPRAYLAAVILALGAGASLTLGQCVVLFANRVPEVPGGGTVAYVNTDEHRYLDDPSHREEGGTPAIIESIRAGLVFQLKEAVGTETIRAAEDRLLHRAVDACQEPKDRMVIDPDDSDREEADGVRGIRRPEPQQLAPELAVRRRRHGKDQQRDRDREHAVGECFQAPGRHGGKLHATLRTTSAAPAGRRLHQRAGTLTRVEGRRPPLAFPQYTNLFFAGYHARAGRTQRPRHRCHSNRGETLEGISRCARSQRFRAGRGRIGGDIRAVT